MINSIVVVLIVLQLTVTLTGLIVSIVNSNLGFINIMKSIGIGFLSPLIIADLVIELFRDEFRNED